MTYAFTSERCAEEFVAFLEEEYELEVDVLSYLHVDVDESELPGEEALSLDRINEKAEELGAADSLL